MQDTPLNRIVFGSLFIVIGIVLIVCHRKLRELGDRLKKYDPLLRQGDLWTGEYTRGGLILTDAITIIKYIIIIEISKRSNRLAKESIYARIYQAQRISTG